MHELDQGGRGRLEPLPLAARLGFTLWMVFWVPVVLSTQGPQNFWWLCNLAQFIVLYALWRPNRLLISSQAGTVAIVGLFWTLDFAIGLATGGDRAIITAYMFDAELPLLLKLTSTYHCWLPILVLWMCCRQGYDRRGVWLQCAIGTVAIVGAWLFGDPERNLNYTHRPFNIEQAWMPHELYIGVLCITTAVLIYLPGHWLATWILSRRVFGCRGKS